MSPTAWQCTIVSAVSVLFAIGCGKSESYVTGQVTMDDRPLPGGGITFNPVEHGPAAYGTIDEDGRYSLNVGDKSGLPPGEYVVTVVGMGTLPPLLPDGTQLPGKVLTPALWRSGPIRPDSVD